MVEICFAASSCFNTGVQKETTELRNLGGSSVMYLSDSSVVSFLFVKGQNVAKVNRTRNELPQ